MINQLLNRLLTAVRYVRNHPQILFALMLLIVIPLLFLYTGQQFLEVGKSNQDRLQKDKVGIMHDVLSSLLLGTEFNLVTVQRELDRLAALNPDIVDYSIAREEGNQIMPLIARDPAVVGIPAVNTDLYINASLRTDESIIFEFYDYNTRFWSAYRSVQSETGVTYFIYTQISFENIDALLSQREAAAYITLLFVYLFLLGLAYWHIRLTDYRYLYVESQKAIETKDLFTNMIAHELRSPLTAMRGYASLLKDHLTDTVQREQADRIEQSAERLLSIVNDLLDVARLQSGKLGIEIAPTELSAVLTAVVAELTVMAGEKGSTIVFTGAETTHTVQGDQKRLHQVLTNVVSNAIKYTEQGQIQITVEEQYATVEVRVKDTGMGISAEDQKKLFAPFFRVENADVSNITGTGLGMWITKELIELMGGTIGVESIKGVGTQIVITLPKPHR